jgi:hypothetical protein
MRGAGIGALVGLAFGGTVAIVGSADEDDGLDALIRTEQWEPVAQSDLQWGVGPVAGGGLELSVSLRF